MVYNSDECNHVEVIPKLLQHSLMVCSHLSTNGRIADQNSFVKEFPKMDEIGKWRDWSSKPFEAKLCIFTTTWFYLHEMTKWARIPTHEKRKSDTEWCKNNQADGRDHQNSGQDQLRQLERITIQPMMDFFLWLGRSYHSDHTRKTYRYHTNRSRRLTIRTEPGICYMQAC